MDLSISGGQPFLMQDLDILDSNDSAHDSNDTWTAFRIGSTFGMKMAKGKFLIFADEY